jgi:hypothetical protein
VRVGDSLSSVQLAAAKRLNFAAREPLFTSHARWPPFSAVPPSSGSPPASRPPRYVPRRARRAPLSPRARRDRPIRAHGLDVSPTRERRSPDDPHHAHTQANRAPRRAVAARAARDDETASKQRASVSAVALFSAALVASADLASPPPSLAVSARLEGTEIAEILAAQEATGKKPAAKPAPAKPKPAPKPAPARAAPAT